MGWFSKFMDKWFGVDPKKNPPVYTVSQQSEMSAPTNTSRSAVKEQKGKKKKKVIEDTGENRDIGSTVTTIALGIPLQGQGSPSSRPRDDY
jgi:hypothetical protein